MTPKQIIYPLHYIRPLLHSRQEVIKKNFHERLSELLRLPQGFVPLGRARTGIYLLIKAYVSEKRKRVLLSPYTIPYVVNMVRFVGGIPIFIDRFPRSTHIVLTELEERLVEQTDCVLSTHYYLNQDSFGEIESLCKRYGAAPIEDCAISSVSRINGHSVGTQSAGGVFSFSTFKFLNYFWGGALIASDSKVQERISEEVRQWPRLRFLQYWPQLVRTLKHDLVM